MSPGTELRFEVRSRPDPAFPKRTRHFVWDRDDAQQVGQSWAARWRAEEDCRARNARNRAHRGLPALPELEPRPRELTPKQRLVAHIEEMHGGFNPPRGARLFGRPARGWTFKELGFWHARQHHRYVTNHYHAGPNTDANNRPPGWWTGADSVRRQP